MIKNFTSLTAWALFFAVAIFLVVLFSFIIAPLLGGGTSIYVRSTAINTKDTTKKLPQVFHIQTPKAVKAIYMSQCAASDKSFRRKIVKLVEDTEINSIVIDAKDFSGTVSFPQEGTGEKLKGAGCVVPDMKEFVESLHKKGIYVIARITVFQDPVYTKAYPDLAVQSKKTGGPWEDYKGLEFVDVGARPFWDYIINISLEARDIGFDELNFDYIRYPSDGPMSDVVFDHSDYTQRPLELEKFFRYLSTKVRVPDAYGFVPKLSADLFGMTTTNKDDLNIGQVQERTTPYFDYVNPMTYPSHYPPGFNGYANPNKNIYGVIKYSVDQSIKRLVNTTTSIDSLSYSRIGTSTPAIYRKPSRDVNVLRPWLQDFNYGGEYGAKEVREQIQAVYDAGLNSWMLWSSNNYYTKGGLEKAQ